VDTLRAKRGGQLGEDKNCICVYINKLVCKSETTGHALKKIPGV